MARATYKFFVDWDSDNGLNLSNFENGDLDGWEAFGTTPPGLYINNRYSTNPRAAQNLIDDFSGTILDNTKWTTTAGNVTVSGGAVHLDMINPLSYIGSQSWRLLNSYYQMKVTLPVLGPTHYVFVEAVDNGNNNVSFFWDGTLSTMYMRHHDGVTAVNTDTSIPYDPTNMAYLRFRETSGTFYWETSPDGLVWTVQRQQANALNATQVYLSFSGGYWGSEAPAEMLVSKVNTGTLWPIYQGDYSMMVAWNAYNPFQFDVVGKGFDKGRFGSVEFGNPADSFRFDTSGLGFDQGRFGSVENTDPVVSEPAIHRSLGTDLVVGRDYLVKLVVYLNSGNTTGARISLLGSTESSTATTTGEFEELHFTFTATETEHTLVLAPVNTPVQGDVMWVDRMRKLITGEEVSNRIRGSSSLEFSKGRDGSRRTDAMEIGTVAFDLDNQTLDYSPENPDSPLKSMVKPGKEFQVIAQFDDEEYMLFDGYLTEFTIRPHRTEQFVGLTATDLLGYLGDVNISTELYKGLRTGEALHKVLDQIKWPSALRDIDAGASVLPWWWADETTALEAMDKLRAAEGPSALYYIDGSGKFIFRDRHHRFLNERSRNVQQSFLPEDDGTSPGYSDFEYDWGWNDILNDIAFEVPVRIPSDTPEEVYTSEDTIIVGAGETKEIEISGSDPFYDAITPVVGKDFTKTGNYTITLSRTSGASTTVRILGGVGGCTITGLKLRATVVKSENSVKVSVQDTESINEFKKKSYTETPEFISLEDAIAIANILLGYRSRRLPIVTLTVNNGTDERLRSILETQVSDRVRIVNNPTFVDHDHHIETLAHSVSAAGTTHSTTYGLERVLNQVDNVFTFDDPLRGFDMGLFGYNGIDTIDHLFILNQSNLGEGLLGF